MLNEQLEVVLDREEALAYLGQLSWSRYWECSNSLRLAHFDRNPD
jgi:hypothetical protein